MRESHFQLASRQLHFRAWRDPFIGVILLGCAVLAWTGCQSREKEIAKHFQLAEQYIAQGKPDDAIVEYTAILGIDPDNAQAHFQLGKIYVAHSDNPKNPKKAVREFHEVLRLEPKNAEAWLLTKDMYLKWNDPASAIKTLEDALLVGAFDSNAEQKKSVQANLARLKAGKPSPPASAPKQKGPAGAKAAPRGQAAASAPAAKAAGSARPGFAGTERASAVIRPGAAGETPAAAVARPGIPPKALGPAQRPVPGETTFTPK